MLKTQAAFYTGQRKRTFFYSAAAIAGGFLVSGTASGEGVLPILAALTGAMDITGGLFLFLGSALAFFLKGGMSGALSEIVSLLGILIAKVIFYEFCGRDFKAAGSAFITAGACGVCGAVIALAEASGLWGMSLALFRAVLAGSLAYFLVTAVNAFRKEGRLVFTGVQGGALAGVFVAAVTALCGAELFFFNFGRILGIVVLLIAARKFQSTGGGIVSALLLGGLTLFSPELARPAVLIGIAAVIAGAFASKGLLPMMLVFLASNAAGLTLLGMTPGSLKLLADLLAACGIFLLIPEERLSALTGEFSAKEDSEYAEFIASRLDYEAKTIHSVQRNLSELSGALEKRRKCDGGLSVQVCDKVCGGCRNNLNCWETRFDDTFQMFEELSRLTEQNGGLREAELPAGLSSCLKKSQLAEEFTTACGKRRLERQAENRMRSMQGILKEQMTASRKILMEISRELTEGASGNRKAAQAIQSVLSDKGVKSPKAHIYEDDQNKYFGEIYYSGKMEDMSAELSLELSGLLDRNIEITEMDSVDGTGRIFFQETPAFHLETGFAKKPGHLGQVSGDSHEIFKDHRGKTCVLISDGMGSGQLAAVDSCMTVNYLSKLLKAGTGLEGALHLINSALLSKSKEESFATVDLAQIDPGTGETELVKLGASSTFLLSEGKLSALGMKSLPVGILGEIHPQRKNFCMKHGDVLVMTSDGIGEADYPAVSEILKHAAERSAKEISEEILKAAAEIPKQNPEDDITVVTVKIHKSEI